MGRAKDPVAHRRIVTAHARHNHCCSCGRVVFGNGGKTSHREMHRRKADGHAFITESAFDRLFPHYGRCPVAGCLLRQDGKLTTAGGHCETHARREADHG